MRFNFSLIQQNIDILLDGVVMTLQLILLGGLLSLIAGVLLAMARQHVRGFLRGLLTAYVEVMRNTPLLITLYLIYFGLPMIGLIIPTFTCVIIALVMQHSVFISEIMRGGFLSVNATQIEAGKALGMTSLQIFRIVRFPQILGTIVPPLTGALVIILHDSSLSAAISLVDLTMAAKVISQRTAASFEPFVAIAVCYTVISIAMGAIAQRIERRMKVFR